MRWMLNDLRGLSLHRWFLYESLSNISDLSNHNGLENNGNRSRSRLVALPRRDIAGLSPLVWSYLPVVQYLTVPTIVLLVGTVGVLSWTCWIFFQLVTTSGGRVIFVLTGKALQTIRPLRSALGVSRKTPTDLGIHGSGWRVLRP